MKKITRYLQKQALQYSDEKYSSAAYLSPRKNHEPQEHIRHRTQADIRKTAIEVTQGIPQHAPPPYNRQSSGHRAQIPSRISSNIQRVQYASDNILQSYELFIQETPPVVASPDSTPNASGTSTPDSSTSHIPTQKYWIVFIHGGYFRDPSVLASSFHRTLSLLSDPDTTDPAIRDLQRHIAGYVSINYRLAPHEAHPQDPDTTPPYEMRNAKWPEMLDDVLSALKHWQRKHPEVGPRYLLVGHSVGATLGVNALLASDNNGHGGVTPPLGVVGVSGIYDFIRLHERFPEYKGMTRNAVDEKDWERVSPARRSRREFERAWSGSRSSAADKDSTKRRKRWLILAHSHEDTLVDWEQVEVMGSVFEDHSDNNNNDDDDEREEAQVTVMTETIEIMGKHNACWEDGRELARVIREGVGEIMGVDDGDES